MMGRWGDRHLQVLIDSDSLMSGKRATWAGVGMIYNRAMQFQWDEEKKLGFLTWKGRTFRIEGPLDSLNARKRAEEIAAQRGWKRPSDKIYGRALKTSV